MIPVFRCSTCVLLLLSGLFSSGQSASAQLFLHDELVSGDLSDDFRFPDIIDLPGGSSFLRLGVNPNDVDLFTLQLGEQQQLDSIVVRDYQSALGNITFLGFQTGEVLSEPPSDQFDGEIDFVIFGDWAVNEDILPLMLQTNPDLSAPLRERSLAFWANETGPSASFVLEFKTSDYDPVPEPGSLCLLLLSGLLAGWTRRRNDHFVI